MKQTINQEKINRVEVIDETGRILVLHNVQVDMSIQDDEQTMKVFVKQTNPTPKLSPDEIFIEEYRKALEVECGVCSDVDIYEVAERAAKRILA